MHQRREDDTQRYVDETLAAVGRIDGFFNNAGIEGKQNLTEDFSADEFDRVVSINLRGVFLGLEKVLKVMREQGSGAVVNTASVGGIRGIGRQSGNAAAKHGVVGLTRNSAVEGHPATTDLAVTVVLGIRDRALVIVDATAEPKDDLPDVVEDAVLPLLDDLLAPLKGQQLFDVGPIITALEAVIPSAAPDLALGDDVLALRFGADGAFTPQLDSALTPPHDWGVFLDADQTLDLVRRRVPQGVPVQLSWQPNGPDPAIGASLSYQLEVVGLEVAAVVAVLTVKPQFVAPSVLRLAASWGIDLTGILSIGEAEARRQIRSGIRRTFATATHDGPQSFFFDIPLPALPDILGSVPSWAGIGSNHDGMTLGGPIRPVRLAPRDLLDVTVFRFGRPVWWGSCRERAAVGSGNPSRGFASNDPGVRVQAGVNFTDAGALCSTTLYPPHDRLAPLLGADAARAGFDLTVGQARAITRDVRMLVRTARGARVVDLGRPSIRQKDDGNLDVQVNYIDDCLYLSGPWLKVILGQTLTLDDLKTGPLEDPDWLARLGAHRGFNSHIVTLDGLTAGEAITATAPGLRVTVSADEAGRAVVPVFAAIGAVAHDVTIERVSQLPLTGAVSVETTEFRWLADLGEADAAAVRDIAGTVFLGRSLRGEAFIDEWQPDGEAMLLRRDGSEVELNPQPLPPEPPEAARLAATAGIHDVVSAQLVPGFDARLAIVQTKDGRGAIVAAGSGGRVVGEWEGPLIGVHMEGGHALARSGGTVQLFSVRRPGRVTFRDRVPVTG
ncbi:SDR family NAD(P)-dependent oxidoreductase [Microbacterium kunmingense]|uniref:SDR family NAD(P)-dependent oxidoreductase n=1 Tax=Microbacterium kunmingense TaxID=2915939 RepID=UPI0020067737|nr:SDR family NAD(P)-dependent oxidoreductase [Microbacterium kunmingense]